jgi:hypothetical protein
LIRSGEIKWEDLDLDDIDIRLKWAGLFHRRKRSPGKFMMRLKVGGLRVWAETRGSTSGLLEWASACRTACLCLSVCLLVRLLIEPQLESVCLLGTLRAHAAHVCLSLCLPTCLLVPNGELTSACPSVCLLGPQW